jgi:hypothetical protein
MHGKGVNGRKRVLRVVGLWMLGCVECVLAVDSILDFGAAGLLGC